MHDTADTAYADAIVRVMRQRGYRLTMGRDASGRWARFASPQPHTISPRRYGRDWTDAITEAAMWTCMPYLMAHHAGPT